MIETASLTALEIDSLIDPVAKLVRVADQTLRELKEHDGYQPEDGWGDLVYWVRGGASIARTQIRQLEIEMIACRLCLEAKGQVEGEELLHQVPDATLRVQGPDGIRWKSGRYLGELHFQGTTPKGRCVGFSVLYDGESGYKFRLSLKGEDFPDYCTGVHPLEEIHPQEAEIMSAAFGQYRILAR